MMITIRQETVDDLPAVSCLIKDAFANVSESDHQEHWLVERLHRSDTFIPQLSLVAETEDKNIVGYILLTRIEIVSENGVIPSLSVAPLAVSPRFQRHGIGGKLLLEAHNTARLLGYETAVVLGHKDYYPRFGYRKTAEFGMALPFEVPNEYCMIIELVPNTICKVVQGEVHYPDVFFE